MFELSLPHILLLLVIALVVIGPKNLPDIAKTLGKMFGEFQRAADDLKREIKTTTDLSPKPEPEQKKQEDTPPEPVEKPETAQSDSFPEKPPEQNS